PSVPVETLHNALRTMHERAEAVRQERQAALAEAGKVFLAENVKKEGVQVTESGLQYKVLKAGDGAIPARTDHVRVHYT
ncbi:FKBP-type peptidyl-prolyl cis-trans isomerase N-terminal domain-containing protein, partial [Klebsiella aerogenes]